jgi:hypothetical protein
MFTTPPDGLQFRTAENQTLISTDAGDRQEEKSQAATVRSSRWLRFREN